MKAAEKCGIDLGVQASKTYKFDDNLEWAHIDFGVDPTYFIDERKKCDVSKLTSDCTFDKCSNCGICSNLKVKNQVQGKR